MRGLQTADAEFMLAKVQHKADTRPELEGKH